ncbi:MAG TPA: hypothetical protein VK773_13285 [Acidimicrobiales bacterium]|jgi:hypothetical protein|nr:hypothetical protein [Acidimicrobiales bacterium]
MPRRNLVPLVLLAVLTVLTAVFAVLGFRSSPTATTIQVQNAAEKTFGAPTGANSWIMELITSVSVGAGTGSGTTEERIIDYSAPDRMVVYDVSGSSAKLAGVLHQPAISCVLSTYSAMLQGDASWKQTGQTFTRTESLADYAARVPHASGTSCSPVGTTTQGQVRETAVIHSDYLVASRAQVVVAAQGVQGETLVFVKIGDIPVRTLK